MGKDRNILLWISWRHFTSCTTWKQDEIRNSDARFGWLCIPKVSEVLQCVTMCYNVVQCCPTLSTVHLYTALRHRVNRCLSLKWPKVTWQRRVTMSVTPTTKAAAAYPKLAWYETLRGMPFMKSLDTLWGQFFNTIWTYMDHMPNILGYLCDVDFSALVSTSRSYHWIVFSGSHGCHGNHGLLALVSSRQVIQDHVLVQIVNNSWVGCASAH